MSNSNFAIGDNAKAEGTFSRRDRDDMTETFKVLLGIVSKYTDPAADEVRDLTLDASREISSNKPAVAELARVSPQQASVVLGRLVELGIVERRDVPPVALVRLTRDNLAAQFVVSIRGATPGRRRPFGGTGSRDHSAAGQPGPVRVVRPGRSNHGKRCGCAGRPFTRAVDAADTMRGPILSDLWTDQASRALGNPVNVVEAPAEEVPTLLRRKTPSLWREIATEGIVLAGASLDELDSAARHAS